MKNIRIALIATALILMAAPAWAVSNSLGVAGTFNTFVFNDFKGTSDTEGRLAVGGNAKLSNYSVGDKLPSNTTGNVLVVGGDLKFTSGRIYYGDALVGGKVKSNPKATFDGKLYSGQPSFSFKQEEAYLKGLSSSLSTLAATGTDEHYWNGLHLTGNNTDGLNVFNISGDDLKKSTWMSMQEVAADTTILINVSGTDVDFTSMGLDPLKGRASKVLFNFYEATDLMLGAIGVEGSILAPFADVHGAAGVIHGTLIASSFDGPFQQNHVPFEGNLTAPTPIPGAVWLLGSGLAGLVAIRRKRS